MPVFSFFYVVYISSMEDMEEEVIYSEGEPFEGYLRYIPTIPGSRIIQCTKRITHKNPRMDMSVIIEIF